MAFYKRIYDPKSKEPFKISRSKIDLFVECPRCFYLDRRLGITRPSLPGFSLNSAVDTLLKSEFDILRKEKKPHALMTKYGIDTIPYSHPDLNIWRENFKGVEHWHKETNLIISGAIDDIWINKKEELSIVDYKSTSTEKEISLEDRYKQGYKKQLEVYQWIFKHNGFNVSKTGYFIFANASKNNPKFDGVLNFRLSIISYDGDDRWVEPTIVKLKKCLDSNEVPKSSPNCEYCSFANNFSKV